MAVLQPILHAVYLKLRDKLHAPKHIIRVDVPNFSTLNLYLDQMGSRSRLGSFVVALCPGREATTNVKGSFLSRAKKSYGGA